MSEFVSANVFVEGRVQGVFYRESTKRRATQLGVHGWIRNLEDGRVEAFLEGKREAVEELLAYMRKGPPTAAVRDLAFESAPLPVDQRQYHSFSVLR